MICSLLMRQHLSLLRNRLKGNPYSSLILKMEEQLYTILYFNQIMFSNTALERFKEVYKKYCLTTAITRRGIIRKQCHAIENDFSSEMPNFKLR